MNNLILLLSTNIVHPPSITDMLSHST